MTNKILLWGKGGRQASARQESENHSGGTNCKYVEDGNKLCEACMHFKLYTHRM